MYTNVQNIRKYYFKLFFKLNTFKRTADETRREDFHFHCKVQNIRNILGHFQDIYIILHNPSVVYYFTKLLLLDWTTISQTPRFYLFSYSSSSSQQIMYRWKNIPTLMHLINISGAWRQHTHTLVTKCLLVRKKKLPSSAKCLLRVPVLQFLPRVHSLL